MGEWRGVATQKWDMGSLEMASGGPTVFSRSGPAQPPGAKGLALPQGARVCLEGHFPWGTGWEESVSPLAPSYWKLPWSNSFGLMFPKQAALRGGRTSQHHAPDMPVPQRPLECPFPEGWPHSFIPSIVQIPRPWVHLGSPQVSRHLPSAWHHLICARLPLAMPDDGTAESPPSLCLPRSPPAYHQCLSTPCGPHLAAPDRIISGP